MATKTKNALVSALEKDANRALTENGAETYASTLSSLLDFFAHGGAMRSRSDDQVLKVFSAAFAESRLLAVKALFYFRDIRGGQGERRLFRVCYKWIAEHFPAVAEKNLHLVPTYGRWDDLYVLRGTSLWDKALSLLATQLRADAKVVGAKISGEAEMARPVKLTKEMLHASTATRTRTRVAKTPRRRAAKV